MNLEVEAPADLLDEQVEPAPEEPAHAGDQQAVERGPGR
jgi:hypothetical protein